MSLVLLDFVLRVDVEIDSTDILSYDVYEEHVYLVVSFRFDVPSLSLTQVSTYGSTKLGEKLKLANFCRNFSHVRS